jgi:uncharacterized membrane-anchored protein
MQGDCEVIFFLAVVVFCHTLATAMGRFMFKAQDKGMTDGDYVFFTMASIPVPATKKPWITYNMTGLDFNYRLKALYAMKQVRATDVSIVLDTVT